MEALNIVIYIALAVTFVLNLFQYRELVRMDVVYNELLDENLKLGQARRDDKALYEKEQITNTGLRNTLNYYQRQLENLEQERNERLRRESAQPRTVDLHSGVFGRTKTFNKHYNGNDVPDAIRIGELSHVTSNTSHFSNNDGFCGILPQSDAPPEKLQDYGYVGSMDCAPHHDTSNSSSHSDHSHSCDTSSGSSSSFSD